MILFDDIDLCSLAPVKVVDVMVGEVKTKAVSRERPLQGGVDFVRATPTTRTISIQFALLQSDITERESYLSAVRSWAHPGTAGKLVVPSRPSQYIVAVCKGLPEPSSRQWWEDRLKVTFTAYDPFFRSLGSHNVPAGQSTFVTGNAPPLAVLTKTVQAGAQTITASDGERTLSISGTLEAGVVTVDLWSETVTHSTMGNIDHLVTFTSRFPSVGTGQTTITGMDLTYVERWY